MNNGGLYWMCREVSWEARAVGWVVELFAWGLERVAGSRSVEPYENFR